MLILGVVLLLATGALTVGMVLGNTHGQKVEVFGYSTAAFSVGELFVIGVVTGVIAGLALAMVLSGMRRSSRKRRERRAELKAKRTREQELQEENARLARELDQQRRAGASASAPTTAPGRPDGPGGSAASAGSHAAERTQPMTTGAGGFGSPQPSPGSAGASKDVERPGGPPGQAPTPSTDSPQEGRRPLS